MAFALPEGAMAPSTCTTATTDTSAVPIAAVLTGGPTAAAAAETTPTTITPPSHSRTRPAPLRNRHAWNADTKPPRGADTKARPTPLPSRRSTKAGSGAARKGGDQGEGPVSSGVEDSGAAGPGRRGRDAFRRREPRGRLPPSAWPAPKEKMCVPGATMAMPLWFLELVRHYKRRVCVCVVSVPAPAPASKCVSAFAAACRHGCYCSRCSRGARPEANNHS